MATNERPHDPSTHSPGNAGARGSRGQANRGASEEDIPDAGTQRESEPSQDLRDADAQGGGGAASSSSRSGS